jgi:predicted MFS family arabinose efflux permease
MILFLQPIKEDLRLSDTQLGLLTGIAFGLFYATFGVPLARWADRGNRVTLTAVAIGLWGVTVMLCLFVTNYAQLVLCRVFAAVGESGCKPPTYSLLGDYFPETAARTRAMSIYIAGSPLSNLLSFFLGGWLNELYGWRMTFFLLGIPGLILALLVKTTIAEPRARQLRVGMGPAPPPLKAVLSTLWRRRSLRHLSMALILYYTMGLGLGPWYAAFMMRSHGMGTGQLGVWLGLIFSIAGVAGVLVGGYVTGRWFAANESGQMRLSAAMVAALVPCYIAFLTLPGSRQALFALIPLMLIFSIFLGPTYVLMQRLVADPMRATVMAVVMLLANLIGFGIGPQVVGMLSDFMTPIVGNDGLRYAMLSMSFVALWSAYHFWCVARTVAGDLATVAAELLDSRRLVNL